MSVLTARHDEVVEITLDWPDVRNALGPSEGRALRKALEDSTTDSATGAVVLSANGKAFCAGGNLGEIVRLAREGRSAVRDTIYREFQGVFRAIAESPVPVISAVDGPAIGFGCDLALAGQATFVGQGGWFAQGWARAGLIPATGGMLYVARRGGPQAVWRLTAADRVDGPTAESWGLAIACENGRAGALAMARSLSGLPREALRAMTRLAMIDSRDAHLVAALEHQIQLITSDVFSARAADILGSGKTSQVDKPR